MSNANEIRSAFLKAGFSEHLVVVKHDNDTGYAECVEVETYYPEKVAVVCQGRGWFSTVWPGPSTSHPAVIRVYVGEL